MATFKGVNTIPLFKSETIVAGTAGTSGIVDLRDISKIGNFSISYTIATAGGVATCGSSTISYQGCPVFDGTYITPTNGTCATIGADGGSDIIAITPPVMPFMKFFANVGTNGTAVVTAALHVR